MEYKFKKTPKELEVLKKKFKKLSTIAEKYDFWQWNLGISYCYASRMWYEEMKDFKIKPMNSLEIEELNLKILDDYNLRIGLKNIDSLIHSFNSKLEQEIQKEKFIEQEYERAIAEMKRKSAKQESVYHSYHKFFKSAFDDYYKKDQLPNYSLNAYATDSLIGYHDGQVMGEYLKFLERQLNTLKKGTLKTTESDTTVKKQILILYYLGLTKSFQENISQSSKLLGVLLNKSPQSIKEALTRINLNPKLSDIKTKENLEFVFDLFTKLKYTEQIKKVKIDIEKLS